MSLRAITRRPVPGNTRLFLVSLLVLAITVGVLALGTMTTSAPSSTDQGAPEIASRASILTTGVQLADVARDNPAGPAVG